MMTEISRMAKLSHEYTNHSCRATTVHVLDEAQVPSRHIMSVTGHKSESSLKTYSGKTCEKNKKTYLTNDLTGHMSLPEKQNKVSCISTYISTLGRYENIK
jgi:hypothetical protein